MWKEKDVHKIMLLLGTSCSLYTYDYVFLIQKEISQIKVPSLAAQLSKLSIKDIHIPFNQHQTKC